MTRFNLKRINRLKKALEKSEIYQDLLKYFIG